MGTREEENKSLYSSLAKYALQPGVAQGFIFCPFLPTHVKRWSSDRARGTDKEKHLPVSDALRLV